MDIERPYALQPSIRTLPRAVRAALAILLFALTAAYLLETPIWQPWQPSALLGSLVDDDWRPWGILGIFGIGALLVLLMRALARGKRQAWVLTTALLSLALLGALLEHASRRSLIVLLALLVLALATAPLFSTRSDLRAAARGYAALALAGWLTWGQATLHQLWRAGSGRMSAFPARLMFVSLRLTAYALLIYGVWQVIRPALVARVGAKERSIEREEAVAVVRSYGETSTAHFALGADKRYFWSPTRQSLIAYRVVGGVALALADPIGPPHEREETLDDFLAHCQRQDWRLALYQIGPEIQRWSRQQGLFTVKIGEDALVDAQRFTLQGKASAAVRHAVARARRGGVSVRIINGAPLPEPLWRGMEEVSATWLHTQDAKRQFGFSMGRFPGDWSSALLTAVAVGPAGRVEGFVTWTPLYAGNGWALDMMRRRHDATPGAMELVLADSLLWAQSHGCERMTLGLVPFAGVDAPAACADAREAEDAAPFLARRMEQSAHYLHRRGLLLGAYRSLYFFKDKFQPVWEARYLAVSEVSALPQVLAALSQAMGVGWREMARDVWRGLRST
jgi:phosphatidylglycerol lysyltransferase